MAAMCGCCFTPLLVLNRKKKNLLAGFPSSLFLSYVVFSFQRERLKKKVGG